MKDTRKALLESACRVFAEKGFQDANVAEICRRAKANIASINYHFGGKKKLYAEVLQYTADVADQEYPIIFEAAELPSPQDRLAAFIRAQFQRSHCDGLAGCFDRILTHEMTNPSFAHATVFRDIMRDRRTQLRGLLRELLPPDTDEPHLRICLHNVVSLFAFQKFTRARRERRKRECGPCSPSADELARFATTFAMGGIQAIAEETQQGVGITPDACEVKD